MQAKSHWEQVYSTKSVTGVSWYQAHAAMSLHLMGRSSVDKGAAIIDVGGGASTLVDDLLEAGHANLTVLDLSESALAAARQRLGDRAREVHWVAGDITQIELPAQAYDIWHDRAVFHFLTEAQEREAYVRALRRAVKPGGHVVIATFAEEGPQRCSGLPVVRYSAEALQAQLGLAFMLLQRQSEEHHTPSGTVQKFIYGLFRKIAE